VTESSDPLALLSLLPPAAIHDRLGIALTSASPTRVTGTMPVAGNTQPFGLLHGGASLVLAESLGSFGAAVAGGGQAQPVGIEINASHHRAVTGGTVHGEATVIRHGRTLSTWQVTIRDDQDRLVCTARITCLMRDAPGSRDVPDS
jgi:1,4-dihydroxy-2-naphthoyl-CoA hydrolase